MPEVKMTESVLTKTETEAPEILAAINPSTQLDGVVAFSLMSPEKLDTLLEEWSDLAQHASESNTFYEPAFFQAASRHLDQQAEWQIIVVQDSKSNEMLGFFPFQRDKGPCGLRRLSLWKSKKNYLTTPLIRSGFERAVWNVVMEHVKSLSPRIDLVEFPMNIASGRIHQELHSLIRDDLLMTYQYDHHSRAELRTGANYEEYLKAAVGGHHLREYRRMRRRLDNLGQLEFRSNTDSRNANCWASWFLDLEAKGWKGIEGTALQQAPDKERFFRELVSKGLEQERVEMRGLFLDGEPIALAVTLLSEQGNFAYKIAFDENYKKYSPGMLLQLHITQDFLEEKKQQWFDSCAIPNHPMINRLWTDRRSIQHLVISTGRPFANLVLGSMELFRAVKRSLRRSKSKNN